MTGPGTTSRRTSGNASRRPINYARRDLRLAAFLIAPAGVAIVTVMIVPLGFAIVASLFHYQLGREAEATFVFLDNYVRFFADPVAARSLLNTLLFTAMSLTLCIVVGVGIAVYLNSLPARVGNLLRAVFAMPVLISPIIVSLIWRYMYDPTYGIIFYLLGVIGLDGFGGLTSATTALLCIAIADVWASAPFIMLVVSAGLASIPEEYYEAARIDGASAFRSLFSITIPLLYKVLVVLILIRGTDAFRVFDLVYGLTGGGPANSTTSLSIYAYKQAFENNQMGFAMAVAVITLIGLVILFGPLMRNSARGKEGS
ncbi:MAG: sugar ABC transporter permease [Propionibacteriaceae bacterium]|nr:sugar ABC transporter permease [Propionibacteriaceae bacterium]